MKIFYKQDWLTWNKLASSVDDNIAEVYEIRIPGDYWTETDDTDGANIIRLWNEDVYREGHPASLILGQSDLELRNFLFLFENDYKPYLSKIEKAVGDDKEIVLAIENDAFSKQLVEYFLDLKKQRGVRIHILFNARINEKDEQRVCLRYLEHLDGLDSVAVFNPGDLRNVDEDDRLEINGWREIYQACEDIIAEEASELVKRIPHLAPKKEMQLWFAVMPSRDYELIKLQDEDFQKIEESKKVSVQIAPNEGRKTCEKLRQYRKEFRVKHHIKMHEENCDYSGECKGTCEHCDSYALNLWREAYGVPIRVMGEIAPITGISRLRENLDGPGIRTLVAMNECNLNCQYCLNRNHVNSSEYEYMSVSKLAELVVTDAAYFEATGGGVTFGGGEPLLESYFIKGFKNLLPQISIAVETSLNVPTSVVEGLLDVIDYWIVDVKDMSDFIYKNYTGESNSQVIQNLRYLSDKKIASRVSCRVPRIEHYNTDENVDNSIRLLREMGFEKIERFTYQV